MKTEYNVRVNKKLFPVLVPSAGEKKRIWDNNESIDYRIENNLEVPSELKAESAFRLTAMYGPKACNFKCPNYCCTEGIAKGYLKSSQLKEVLSQAKELGVRVSYWPGLGESLLHKDFLSVLEHSDSLGISSVVFTNGSLFWNDDLAKKVLGMNSKSLLKKLGSMDTHFYVKYWSSNPLKAAEMVGVDPEYYPYTKIDGKSVPLALKRLMEYLPKERIGVEIMASSENYDDVVNNIIPTINEMDLYGYLEPVILSGNAEGRSDLLLSPKQRMVLQDSFVSGGKYCIRRQSLDIILVGDRLSPGIVIPPRDEERIIDDKGNVKDLFSIYHNDYFRDLRRKAKELNGCLCRAVYEGKIKLGTTTLHVKTPEIGFEKNELKSSEDLENNGE